MALTQLEPYMVNTSGSYTVATLTATTEVVAAGASIIPVKITSVQSATSGYVSDSATAVSTSGGYLIITGSGFQSGCQVLIGSSLTTAAATTFVNSTTLNVQLNATSSGTYPVHVVNTDGSVGISVPGIVFDAYPVWSTGATLPQQAANLPISLSLSATDSNSLTYSITQGSTLPSGLSLSSSGLLTGTITGITNQTTYTFSIDAVDSVYNEHTARTFSVTVVVSDPYFNVTTLLLNGEGTAATNGAQNNTFLDSSSNAYSITRNGTPAQGTFSPYGTLWSNYFAPANPTYSNCLYINQSSGTDLGSGSFTWECWLNPSVNNQPIATKRASDGALTGSWMIATDSSNNLYISAVTGSGPTYTTSGTPVTLNVWNHLAIVRNSSNVLSIYINGTRAYTGTVTYNWTCSQIFFLGTNGNTGGTFPGGGGLTGGINGYVSNFRIVQNTAVYDPTLSSLTVPTSPLTAISGTSLLICQSNRFVDNSTNNLTLNTYYYPQVQRFSPFQYSQTYSTSVIGGSGYFNGSTDYLSIADNANLEFGAGTITVELWFYMTGTSGYLLDKNNSSTGAVPGFSLYVSTTTITWYYDAQNNGYVISPITTTVSQNAWHHLVLVRSVSGSTTNAVFLDGVRVGTSTTSTAFPDSTQNFRIGAAFLSSSPIYFFTGYISNLRFVKGTAVYDPTQTSFSPPQSPLTAISNTQLLLSGTNGGIIDQSSRNNLITVGSAQVSSTQVKYGTGSLKFNGTTDYLTAIPSNVFSFNTGDFTVEGWYYVTASADQGLWDQRLSNGSTAGFACRLITSTNYIRVIFNNATALTTSQAVTLNQWNHIALVRASGVVTVYLNGTAMTGGSATATTPSATDTNMWIGKLQDPSYFYNGYIDDFRVTKGYARYTTTFTPPTQQLIGQ
jgi:hypothetical protein